MKKIFLAFLLTFCSAIPSFAQNIMTQINNMNMMMMAMEDDQQQQQQIQAQAQAPIVVQIQYQTDGTPVVTSSAPIQVQTATPQIQSAEPKQEDGKIGEILLALFLGLFVGSILTKMFSRAK